MAQEIVTWCDRHMDRDERVPGTPRFVAVDPKKPVVSDLCDTCDKEVLQPIRDFIAEFGRPADQASGPINPSNPKRRYVSATPENSINCPEEGCSYFARSKSSFRDHMQTEHNVSLAVYEGKRGITITGEEVKYYCDSCPAGFTTPQGRGAHMSSEHGYTGPANPANDQQQLPEPPKTAKKTAKKAN